MTNSTEILRARRISAGIALFACLFFWTATAEPVNAQTSPQVVRVEEEWELIVTTPDPNSDAPQVNCLISPVGNTDSVHAAFEMNYQSMPEFVAGGLQLQIWNNEQPIASRKFPNGAIMQQTGETVRWTQTMSLENGLLNFEVIQGTSTSWGAFGGQGYLKASVATTLDNLNGYSPTVSINNSGVAYAGNRVQALTLRKVRLTTSTNQVLEANTLYSVYPRQ